MTTTNRPIKRRLLGLAEIENRQENLLLMDWGKNQTLIDDRQKHYGKTKPNAVKVGQRV